MGTAWVGVQVGPPVSRGLPVQIPRYDCMLVSMDTSSDGMLSMEVAWALCFFSFAYINDKVYSCILIHWFDCLVDEPGELTGMWMVFLSFVEDGAKHLAIIPVD